MAQLLGLVIILQYFYTSIPQYLNTSIPQYHNTSIPQYLNASILNFFNTSILQYFNSQYFNTSILQFAILQYFNSQYFNTSILQFAILKYFKAVSPDCSPGCPICPSRSSTSRARRGSGSKSIHLRPLTSTSAPSKYLKQVRADSVGSQPASTVFISLV